MNILYVEDDPDTRQLTALLMRDMGYAVTDVDSAELALGLLRKLVFDAMVIDVSLPGMPGDVLAAEARFLQPNVRIVFATGLGSMPPSEAGAGPIVLHKPYSTEDLAAALSGAR